MTNKETKEKLINALYENCEHVKRVNSVEYRLYCPYCGETKMKFYAHIDPDEDSIIPCHCFKCDEPYNGIFTEDTLDAFNIVDSELREGLILLNKTSSKINKKNKFDEKSVTFDYQIPDIRIGNKTHYVESRIGKRLSTNDLYDIKIITSIKDFLYYNKIKSVPFSYSIIDKIDDHYVGFLSNGNSHILFRDITNKEKYRWIKYPINSESRNNRLLYSIASSIDIFTNDTININISEGVMDILSVKYNIDNGIPNSIYFAVTGHYYEQILLYLLNLGICGSNVILNIYADNDEVFNKDAKNPTTIEYFKNLLYRYKHLYGEVKIHYNLIGKDFGVPKKDIIEKIYTI